MFLYHMAHSYCHWEYNQAVWLSLWTLNCHVHEDTSVLLFYASQQTSASCALKHKF